MLDEVHMPRGEDAPRHRVVAAVATVIRWVAEEDAGDGAAIQLVLGGGRGVGVTETPKNAE